MPGLPENLALLLGVTVTFSDDVPFRVASWDSRILCGWHPDRIVREWRVWEGIAQCLLIRADIAWSVEAAIALAILLRGLFPAVRALS